MPGGSVALTCVRGSVRFRVCVSLGGSVRSRSGVGWCTTRVVCLPKPKAAVKCSGPMLVLCGAPVFSTLRPAGPVIGITSGDHFEVSPLLVFPRAFGGIARLAP